MHVCVSVKERSGINDVRMQAYMSICQCPMPTKLRIWLGLHHCVLEFFKGEHADG
jgi:hypothetical protein